MERTEEVSLIKRKYPMHRVLCSDAFWVVIISLITFVVCAWYIPQRTSIYLANDEFSQYSIAAFFAGYDWSSTTSTLSYYQFGYALLFILPLFWIFGDNILAVYQGSLVINALLAASIVPLTYYLLRQWGMKKLVQDWAYIPVLALSALAGCVVAYSTLGLGEVLLIVLGFAAIALIMYIEKHGANHKLLILFAFLLAYGFSVHMRFVGVLAAGAFVILVMSLLKRIKLRHLISFSLSLGAFVLLSLLIKQYLQTNLWLYSDAGLLGTSGGNDIIYRVGTVGLIFSFEGFIAFLVVLAGHLWYIGLASFLMAYLGVFAIINDIFQKIKKSIQDKEKPNIDYPTLFILVGFIATLIISAIGMIWAGLGEGVRADALIYGRYASHFFIPLILYSLVCIITKKQRFNYVLLVIQFCFIMMTLGISSFWQTHYAHHPFMLFNVINFALFDSIIQNGVVALGGFMLIILAASYIRKPLAISAVLAAATVFNVMAGYRFTTDVVLPWGRSHVELHDLSEHDSLDEAYYLHIWLTRGMNNLPKTQMALPNLNITVIESIFEAQGSAKTLIVDTHDLSINMFLRGLDIKNSSYEKGLLIIDEYSIGSAVETASLPTFIFSTNNGNNDGYAITTDGTHGHAMFGPSHTLEAGSYTFSAQLKLLNPDDSPELLGHSYITHGPGYVLAERTLEFDDFVDGYYNLELHVEAEERLYAFQFRIVTFEGVILQISNITVQG